MQHLPVRSAAQATRHLLWLLVVVGTQSEAAQIQPCALPSVNSSFCRPIHDSFPGTALHIGFVAGGEDRWPDLSTALISLLHYRSCPLHVHFYADRGVQTLIEEFFQPAEYPHVTYTVYDRPLVDLPQSEWYPQANSKLVMDQVTSKDASHLLLLDTDIVIASDICAAQAVFRHMSPGAAFAMAPEMDLWYTKSRERQAMAFPSRRSRHRWIKQSQDGVGRTTDGLNSGVIFWNLTVARSVDWTGLWQRELEGLLQSRGIKGLPNGDQEVFNIVCTEHPELMDIVPAKWNFQLTNHIWESKVFDHAMQDVIVFHGNDQIFKHEGTFWNRLADMFGGKDDDDRCAARKRAQQLWSDVRWLDQQ